MVRLFFMFLLLAAVAFGAENAMAEKRVALIIGNSAYQHTSPLPNPANDAAAIAKKLTEIGFDTVEVKLDQSFSDLRLTLQGFARAARDSDVALVFYAGHGMEVGGVNYLVPVDAKLQSDQDVPYEAFPLDLVLAAIEPARRLRLVMLDACRDNPLAAQMANTSGSTRSIGRGLARIEPQGDTLVAYASKAGSVAEDGDGSNSPFTTALLQHLPTPGLDIRLMFGRVRDSVLEKTGRRQEPFVYGSLGGGELSLVPGAASGAATSPPASMSGTMSGTGGAGVDRAALDLAYWSSIQGSANAGLYKSYLKEFPDGRFRVIAEAKLAELEKLAALPPESPPSRPPAVSHAPLPSGRGLSCATVSDRLVREVCANTVLKSQSGNSYGPANLFDGRDSTAWVEGAKGDGAGSWLVFDFGAEVTVDRLKIANGYNKNRDIFGKNGRLRDIRVEFSGGERFDLTLPDGPDTAAFDLGPFPATWMRLEILSVYRGWKYTDTCLNEVRIEGSR